MVAQLSAQVDCRKSVKSKRLANYVMDLTLAPAEKKVTGTQEITWTNNSPDSVSTVQLYMYLNAFKDKKSSYLRNSERWMRNESFDNELDRGYVNLLSLKDARSPTTELRTEWVADIDNNELDRTSLLIHLPKPVAPGASVTLLTDFESKLPRIIARSGFAEDDFFHFVHWYPKLGVYEKDLDGKWGWNCHQFLPRMEFYGEFGVYDMTIHAPERLVIGASGCRISRSSANGMTTQHFLASDVIDFAWVAYEGFRVVKDEYNGVEIELLTPHSHHLLTDRLVGVVKHSLQYLHDHVGTFPYDKITVMDPPAHAMRSGFMEYPTYITGGSFFAFPTGVKSLESLIAHEFCHQYFMTILATNEKEAPWLDEGFATFFEDQIMEAFYGDRTNSLIDILGYKMGNSQLTRREYVTLSDHRVDAVSTPSWELKGPYKPIIYAKTATVLRTLKNWIGDDTFYDVMRCYYDTYKFSHPRAEDFFGILYPMLESRFTSQEVDEIKAFMHQAIDGRQVCDFAVEEVISSQNDDDSYTTTIKVAQLEDMIIPVEIEVRYTDGNSERQIWNGSDKEHTISLTSETAVESVVIDPDQRIPLDVNLINNSYVCDPCTSISMKYASRGVYWFQNLIQSFSFLF